jgi:F-type H+-transporting ATPase subunit delta
MDESSVSVRYARALYEVSEERGILITLKNDIELIAYVCNKSLEFMQLLKNPVVKSSKKMHIISLIFEEKINELTLDFLKLVIQNKREIFIPAICRNILSSIKEAKGIKTVILTTAKEIDDTSLTNIAKMLEKELESEVEISTEINPRIIGGMILRIDDKQYDASIAAQLKKIKKELQSQ